MTNILVGVFDSFLMMLMSLFPSLTGLLASLAFPGIVMPVMPEIIMIPGAIIGIRVVIGITCGKIRSGNGDCLCKNCCGNCHKAYHQTEEEFFHSLKWD